MAYEEIQSLSILSMIPDMFDIVYDVEKTLQVSRQNKLEKGYSAINICEEHILESDKLDQQCKELSRRQEDILRNTSLEIEEIKQAVYAKESKQNMLKNQIIIAKIELKKGNENTVDEDELSDLITKLCSLRKGRTNQRNLIKEEFNMFKRGIFYYKKYLFIDVTWQSQDLLSFVILNHSASKTQESEACISITFRSKDKGNSFQCLNLEPKLEKENLLLKRYLESDDIQGLVVKVWKAVSLFKHPRKALSTKN